MEAQSLQCPTCGAAVSSFAPRCTYCGALLKTVACPACFGLLFRGAKFCPHCGAKTDALQPEDITGHHCPRCSTSLKLASIGGADVEVCPGCGGLWIGIAAFDQICSDREKQTAALGLDVPAPVSADTEVRYIKCPCCDALMNRQNYAHRAGVIMDVCGRHGIWLDRDELRRIIEFIRAGGLDRARKIEIEQLQRERQSLESARLHTGHTAPESTDNAADSSALGGVLNWLFGW